MLEAKIAASRLKHAINVLRGVSDESVFEISDNRIASRVLDPGNTTMVQVSIDATGGYIAAPEPHTVGIDLERLATFLKRAAAKDDVTIEAKNTSTWRILRGIHQRTMGLFDPDMTRKCPNNPKLSPTVDVTLTGDEFKAIVATAADVAEFAMFRASTDALTIEAVSKEIVLERYKGVLPADQYYERFETEAVGLYDLARLGGIAAGMNAADLVRFQFADDMPCEIEYTRDSVTIAYVLAPRIESNR